MGSQKARHDWAGTQQKHWLELSLSKRGCIRRATLALRRDVWCGPLVWNGNDAVPVMVLGVLEAHPFIPSVGGLSQGFQSHQVALKGKKQFHKRKLVSHQDGRMITGRLKPNPVHLLVP